MCFHKFGTWQDVEISDRAKSMPAPFAAVLITQVIRQQRRCEKCNRVQTVMS